MKVCFIVGTLGRGGAERQLVFMLEALQSLGIGSRILCLTRDEEYERRIKSMGIEVEWVGSRKNRLIRLFAIVKSLKKNPADIVQSSHFYTNIYAGVAGKILRTPSVGAVRSDLSSEKKLHGVLGKYQISLPDFLIVNSGLAYQRAIENGIASDRIEFVRNVVDTIGNASAKASPTKEQINILFVGRLDENKRPLAFVDLAAELKKKYPDRTVKFQIVGDGILKSELESRAKDLNLSSSDLEFLGVCSDMRSIYGQADALVSTSVREGTSNVILEAMAHGLPVIATNSGGTPEILDEDRGILVEPDNAEELLSAATSLIEDSDLRKRLGSSGRHYVAAEHSIENLGYQLKDIYGRLLKPVKN